MTEPGQETVDRLLTRSHRLGADPANTNYAGGNTSAKGTATDPASGDEVELLWVKGSGGDLGTLTEPGLAVLRLDRLRGLTRVYPGPEREDEMVAAFDYCLHGRGGAAPSIDTAMHGLVDSAHVDHLHPDSGIALATAADGEKLTTRCFGDRVVWVPWRRPGFQLGLDIAEIKAANPQAIGCILGGHGITAWGETSDECEARSLEIIRTAAEFLAENGRAEPFGPRVAEYEPLPEAARRERAAALAPVLRGLASTDRRQLGHFTDSAVVLDFLAGAEHPRLAALGTSCPDHFLRTKVRPMVLDLPPSAPLDEVVARLRELHEEYRADYRAYYERHADPDSPAMRGADPAIVLVPGVGMFSFGADAQTARVAGEFYVNAINVMRGAESVSTYAPIPESEKFRIEYWSLEEAKLRRRPAPKPLAGRVALVTGGGSGIGKATARRLAAEGACVIVADRAFDAAQETAAELGAGHRRRGACRRNRRERGRRRLRRGRARVRRGRPGGQQRRAVRFEATAGNQPADWDLQHDVMARGSFLVSREAARTMIAQGLGGDVVYIVARTRVRRTEQCRLWSGESGSGPPGAPARRRTR